MRKILFVHNNNDLYGADVALLLLLRKLNRDKFTPIVVLPNDTRHINRLSAELQKVGIVCLFMNLGVLRRRYLGPLRAVGRIMSLFLGTVSLARLISREKIDIVHSNTLSVVDGALAAFLTRRPHIWHVHELLVSPAWFRWIIHRCAVRLSVAVIANSTAVCEHLKVDAGSYAGRIQVILNGVDLQRFNVGDEGRRELRAEWGVADDEILIGMIGKVTRWKGQVVFARAAAKVIEKYPNIKCVAVGGVFDNEAHFMEQFEQEVLELGLEDRFIICGFRTDTPAVLHAFDIFVLPSTWPEPFGLVTIEAMASGKVVVATAHGGSLEIVCSGATGYLVEPNDPDSLAAALKVLLDEPELISRMGAAGRSRAEELFSASRYVQELQDLFETVYLGCVGGSAKQSKICQSVATK